MPSAPLPPNEIDRLTALRGLCVLDTAPEPALDAVTRLAASALSAPISLISLVDEHRQWFKARTGIAATETPRSQAFCAHAILAPETLCVPDASADPRFADNPLVLGPPHIRAYLGAPIILQDGMRIGTVCAIDTQSRPWTDAQKAQLADLAGIAAALLEARQTLQEARVLAEALAATSERLETANAFGEAIAEVAGVGGWRLNHDGRLTWTQQTRRLHEVPADYEPSLASALEFYAPEARAVITDLVANAIETGESYEVELPLITASGRRIWVRGVGRRDGPPDAPYLIGTFQDIGVQREKDAALEAAMLRAETAARAKADFLANMSHEIRTPLNGVIGLAGALARTPLDARQQEMAKLIQGSGQTLERLVSDILDISKIEAGAMTLEIAAFDLQEALETAAQAMRVRADDKGVAFTVAYADNARGLFEGDAVRIKQILSNLVSNAVKFTEAGGVSVEVSVEEGGLDGPTWLTLKVVDTGVGFDSETAKRLFKRFEQADATITRRFGGTGLGLSICQNLSEMMGGEIFAASTPGVGSVFTVRIPLERTMPLADYDRRSAAENPGDADAAMDDGPPMRILLAEDHPTNQRVVALVLEPYGVDLTITPDGQAALEAFEVAGPRGFDVVLMDMQMPVMDGLVAMRRIRAHERAHGWPRVPMAMLSANAMAEHLDTAIQAGADLHIAKPVTPEALINGVRMALALGGMDGQDAEVSAA